MKITNAEVIKSGERDLIDSITADLDWGVIENIFLTEHNLGIDEDIEYKKGDIIAYNDQVAYKLEFAVKVNLSLLINREGEYLSIKISGKSDNKGSENDHGDTHETLAEDRAEVNMVKQKDEQVSVDQDFSEDNAENKIINSDVEVKEDKYIEALEQLSSNENNGDPIS